MAEKKIKVIRKVQILDGGAFGSGQMKESEQIIEISEEERLPGDKDVKDESEK